MTDDPHETLGVGKDATPDEINKAFRRAAKKAHPDAGGSAAEFERLTKAVAKLRDPENEGQPNNKEAAAYERVANFFINSINATVEQSGFGLQVNLDTLDLVSGARDFFNQQIGACTDQINRTQRQIKQFDKAIKRLKSKKKDKSPLHSMLEHHKQQIKRLIQANNAEIEVNRLSLKLLEDYDFVSEEQPNVYLTGNFPWSNR